MLFYNINIIALSINPTPQREEVMEKKVLTVFVVLVVLVLFVTVGLKGKSLVEAKLSVVTTALASS